MSDASRKPYFRVQAFLAAAALLLFVLLERPSLEIFLVVGLSLGGGSALAWRLLRKWDRLFRATLTPQAITVERGRRTRSLQWSEVSGIRVRKDALTILGRSTLWGIRLEPDSLDLDPPPGVSQPGYIRPMLFSFVSEQLGITTEEMEQAAETPVSTAVWIAAAIVFVFMVGFAWWAFHTSLSKDTLKLIVGTMNFLFILWVLWITRRTGLIKVRRRANSAP